MLETQNMSVFQGGSEIVEHHDIGFSSGWVAVTSLESVWVTLLAVGLCAQLSSGCQKDQQKSFCYRSRV